MSNMQLYSHSHWRRTTLEFYFSTTKDADDFAYKRIDSSKDKSSRYCERTLNNVEFVNGLDAMNEHKSTESIESIFN